MADSDAHARGRRILALANRVEHLTAVAAALTGHGVPALQLHGGLRPAERARARVRAAMSPHSPGPLVVLTIDKIAGEGLDAGLDTLFLMNPVSFRGRVIQQVGRVMRTGPDKTGVEVHDYLDAVVPRLERSHRKRRRLLERLGFTTTSAPPPGPSRHATARIAGPGHSGPDRTAKPTAADVRAWARMCDVEVSQRGRISADVWRGYLRGHPVHDDR
ncbi:Lsr2 family DNA-binding protein [Catenulispora pinisilvae]|uniref:Lsr2 family DNA-binding protein n=1 Tax=Catenulispora pinisilvae TaxID=2705253 RepID=UPI0018921151|nr:helicase-related protein [Catenulispora pinisilvae]